MKIFIQIASYRDPDLNNTIKNALETAKYPENITFGICHQKGKESWDTLDKNFAINRVRYYSCSYEESKGACWARSITQSLYNNEEYTLQIDSHSRFEPDWDEKILSLFSSLNDDHAVLSTYPSMFEPGQSYNEYNRRIYICHVYSMTNGFINTRPKFMEDTGGVKKASAIAAGFVFARGHIINSVPYDPEFYFTGEEAGMAVRWYTNGYNLYHPNINLIYHYYTRKDENKHWTDHKNHGDYTIKSHMRLHCLLQRNSDFNLGIYGLGTQRTLEDWRLHSGIDYKNNRLHIDLIDGKSVPFIDHDRLWLSQREIRRLQFK